MSSFLVWDRSISEKFALVPVPFNLILKDFFYSLPRYENITVTFLFCGAKSSDIYPYTEDPKSQPTPYWQP